MDRQSVLIDALMTAQAVWKSEDTVKQLDTMQSEMRDMLGHRAPHGEPARNVPSPDELRVLAGYGPADPSPIPHSPFPS